MFAKHWSEMVKAVRVGPITVQWYDTTDTYEGRTRELSIHWNTHTEPGRTMTPWGHYWRIGHNGERFYRGAYSIR